MPSKCVSYCLKVALRYWSPCHAINSCYDDKKVIIAVRNGLLSVAVISSLMCFFKSLVCKVFWGLYFGFKVAPEKCSRAQRELAGQAVSPKRDAMRPPVLTFLQLIGPDVVSAVTPCC
jgi:hypothetical protein